MIIKSFHLGTLFFQNKHLSQFLKSNIITYFKPKGEIDNATFNESA